MLMLIRSLAMFLNYDAYFHTADILPFPVPSNTQLFDVPCRDTELVTVLHIKC